MALLLSLFMLSGQCNSCGCCDDHQHPAAGVQVPDSVLVRHLGGQAETNRFAIESVLKATMPAVRPRVAVPCQATRH